MAEYNAEGERIIGILFKVIMAVKLHGESNRMVKDASDSFVKTIRTFSRKEPVISIKIVDSRFYFQDEKLICRRENQKLINKACEFFENRSIGEIRIIFNDDTISYTSIHKAAFFLNHSIKSTNPVVWLNKRFVTELIPWIEVDKPLESKSISVSNSDRGKIKKPSKRERGQKTYANALNAIKNLSEKISGNSLTGIRKTQRLIQNMVDLIIEDDSILLGMSTIRDYDDYTYCHSVNVSILAMCLGLNIGLSRKSVEILGICGLFHDLGKIDIPTEIIRKPGKLTPEETRIMEKHTLYSVTKILKLKTSRDLKSQIIRPPFEHHLKFDLTGYPRLNNKKQVSLFGRILTIVDVFDAITSPRSYRPVAYSPDEALGIMIEGSGKDFDPLLLKAFINMIGVYPVGTLLQLDTGELGIVSGKGNGMAGKRPNVVVIKTDNDSDFRKGPLISLEERDAVSMDYIRNIVASFHPGEFGIQPAQYLL